MNVLSAKTSRSAGDMIKNHDDDDFGAGGTAAGAPSLGSAFVEATDIWQRRASERESDLGEWSNMNLPFVLNKKRHDNNPDHDPSRRARQGELLSAFPALARDDHRAPFRRPVEYQLNVHHSTVVHFLHETAILNARLLAPLAAP